MSKKIKFISKASKKPTGLGRVTHIPYTEILCKGGKVGFVSGTEFWVHIKDGDKFKNERLKICHTCPLSHSETVTYIKENSQLIWDKFDLFIIK